MSSYDTAQPHIASYVLLEKDGKIAFLLRANTPWMNNFYSLPAGKVETGESYTQAAIREAKEEAGVIIVPEDLVHVFTMQRLHTEEESNGNPEWVDVVFKAKKWQGEAINAEPDVHSQLDWLDPKNLPDNVISYIKQIVEQIEAGKTYTEFGWEK